MLFSTLAFAVLAPITALALPASESHSDASLVARKPGENLCSLKAPPKLCVPNKNITVAETAQRAYDFYRAFVVDGDAEKMFSLIDDVYVVSCRAPQAVFGVRWLTQTQQHNPGYKSGPLAIWSLFCSGRKIASEASTSWCFDEKTGMSWAKYSTVDRWAWVDGCVHEHVRTIRVCSVCVRWLTVSTTVGSTRGVPERRQVLQAPGCRCACRYACRIKGLREGEEVVGGGWRLAVG